MQFFKLSSGRYFKYDPVNIDFWYLRADGKWIKDPGLMSVYYDAGSDYAEVTEEQINRGFVPLDFDSIEWTYGQLGDNRVRFNEVHGLYFVLRGGEEWEEFPTLRDVADHIVRD